MAVLRFLMSVSLLAGCSATPSSPTPDTPRAVSRCEVRRFDAGDLDDLEESALSFYLYEVRRFLIPSEEGEVVIETRGAPIPLPDLGSVDFQWGSGHGFSLGSLRMVMKGDTIDLELAEWQDLQLGDPATRVRSLRRKTVPAEEVRWLRALVQVMPMVTCRETRCDAPFSSNDFFVLVRAMGKDGEEISTIEFAGYAGGTERFRYIPIQVITDMAEKLGSEEGWTSVPPSGWRSSHFTDAFNRDRGLLLKDHHWWVMDYSCEMLGWFGNEGALETVRHLRDHLADPKPGNTFRLDAILDPASGYLVGPPKALLFDRD